MERAWVSYCFLMSGCRFVRPWKASNTKAYMHEKHLWHQTLVKQEMGRPDTSLRERTMPSSESTQSASFHVFVMSAHGTLLKVALESRSVHSCADGVFLEFCWGRGGWIALKVLLCSFFWFWLAIPGDFWSHSSNLHVIIWSGRGAIEGNQSFLY